jgi:hypothetical protein
MVCGDAGEGALPNAELRRQLGDHRVLQVRYMSLSKPTDWNPQTLSYHVDRTTMIDNFARHLMLKQSIYGTRAQMQPAITDILTIYEQVTRAGRKVWMHPPMQPDDCFHAQLFSWYAWRVLSKDLLFY